MSGVFPYDRVGGHDGLVPGVVHASCLDKDIGTQCDGYGGGIDPIARTDAIFARRTLLEPCAIHGGEGEDHTGKPNIVFGDDRDLVAHIALIF